MKRKIIESRALTRTIDHFIAERKILKEDIEALKKELINNPKTGNIIPGTGGVRKIRLKSFAKGKRGGGLEYVILMILEEKNYFY